MLLYQPIEEDWFCGATLLTIVPPPPAGSNPHAAQIDSAIYYPLHRQPALGTHQRPLGSFPYAEAASATVLALPNHPSLRPHEIERVAHEVLACLRAE